MSSDRKKTRLPSAMVLVYQQELTHSVWQDFESRARTMEGLEKQLKAGVRSGEWVAWRIMRIEKEVWGNGSLEIKGNRDAVR